MTTMKVIVLYAAVLLCSQFMVELEALNINKDNSGLLSVPQYLNASVTIL